MKDDALPHLNSQVENLTKKTAKNSTGNNFISIFKNKFKLETLSRLSRKIERLKV